MTNTEVPNKPKVKINKWWLIGGGTAAAVVYYVYKKSSASTATTATTDTSGDAIDPSTGLSYAEEDGLDYTAVGSPYGDLTSSAPIGSLGSTLTTTGSTPLTNSAYAQDINDYLVNGLGYSQTVVASALGKWLSGSGQALTSQEQAVVQAAQAYGGAPPVGVPTPNYVSNTGQTTTSTGPTVVPDVQAWAQANSQAVRDALAAYQANPGDASLQDAYLKSVAAAGQAANVVGQNSVTSANSQSVSSTTTATATS